MAGSVLSQELSDLLRHATASVKHTSTVTPADGSPSSFENPLQELLV